MLEKTIYITTMLTLLLFLLITIVLRFTLDRRVRKAMPENWVYDALPDHWFWGWGRAVLFGWAAIYRRGSENSTLIKVCYNGFNVYAFASKLEKFFAYTMAISFALSLFFIFIVIPVCDWFGITTTEFWQGLGITPGYLRT